MIQFYLHTLLQKMTPRQAGRSVSTYLPGIFSLLIILISLPAYAEGTKDVAPNPDDVVMLLIGDAVYGNFAVYGGPEAGRLYFQIKDPGEVVYLGLTRGYRANGRPESTGSYNFRIRRASDGSIVHGPFNVHAFNENISSWEDAALGPAAITGEGYQTNDARYFFDPGQAGEYFIEFENVQHIGFWDITIAKDNEIRPGRVYSRNWSFRTPSQNNELPECVWDREFNGTLYSYTTDGFVTRIDFTDSGFQGLSFNVAFNRTGPGTSGDFQSDRMSVQGQNLTKNAAEHLIFLSEPDPMLFPDGACGDVAVADYFNCTEDGGYCLETTVSRPGQVEILMDFNRNGSFDEGLDIRLLSIFNNDEPLSRCIPWDGYKGDGSRAEFGESVNLIVQYTQGTQHWALYDGEFLKNGFCVEPVRPICEVNQAGNRLYWDDRNISSDPGTTQPKDGRMGCDCDQSACRNWNYFDANTTNCSFINDGITEGYGDKNTLNTWWFARSNIETVSNLPIPGVAIDGEEEICPGESTLLKLDIGNTDITSILWQGPNGLNINGGTHIREIYATTPGVYRATIVDRFGCSFTAAHIVRAAECPTDIALDKSADKIRPSVGEKISFSIALSNTGSESASGIVVEDQLPDALTNVVNISHGGYLEGNRIRWQGLLVGAGETLILTYEATLGLGYNFTNLAEVIAMDQQDTDSTPGNGVDTNGNGIVSDDPNDEDDGDGYVLHPIPCDLEATVSNIRCDDNGTPLDPSDDTYTFDLQVQALSASPAWRATDNENTAGVYGQVVSFGPYPISGGAVQFEVQDQFFGADCSVPVSVSPPATCSDQCQIDARLGNVICDDNGTPSDPGDDTYTFELSVDGVNTSDQWRVGTDVYAYGTTAVLGPFPISNGSTQVIVVDTDDETCRTEIIVQAPPACSDQCEISVQIANVFCDDNGTPSHAEDDVYFFDLFVSGSNVSSAGWASPLGIQGPYHTWLTLGPVAIADGDLELPIHDQEDSACSTSRIVVAPPACSDQCLLEATYDNVRCNDEGTPSDPSDDTYTFEVMVTGLNTGTGWQSGGETYDYDTPIVFGPFPISGGATSLLINDAASELCTASITVEAPPSCSDACILTYETRNIICDDNGTPSRPGDDVFYFDLRMRGANQGQNGWLSPMGVEGAYDSWETFGPYPIADGNIVFTVWDKEVMGCATLVMVEAPATCSEQCALTLSIEQVDCLDNGTASDPTDDQYTISVIVNGFNNSDFWTTDQGEVGAYGELVVLGPYPIAEGDRNLSISDQADPTCRASRLVNAPPSCSPVCAITQATVSDIICSDNGTPTDPEDDTFTFQVLVDGYNLSPDGWTSNLAVDGQYGELVTFGPYPVKEGDLALQIMDLGDRPCTVNLDVQAPLSCSDQCSIKAWAENITCLDNGTPSHPEDDMYTFEVIVADINNAGDGWISDEGRTGNYNSVTVFGPYPISEGSRSILFSSQSGEGCSSLVEVTPPATCSDQCLLEAVVLTTDCHDQGTLENANDDTFTYEIRVEGLNISDGWTADDGTTGNYGEVTTSIPHPYTLNPFEIEIRDNANSGCAVNVKVEPPAVNIECPKETRTARRAQKVQILSGSLAPGDEQFDQADDLCWLAVEQMADGNRYYDLLTFQYSTESVDPQAFSFLLYTTLPDNEGTGSLFFDTYKAVDPCCTLQAPNEHNGAVITGPAAASYVATADALLDAEYQLATAFTLLLAPDQLYSLLATSRSTEMQGKYIWLVFSEPNSAIEILSADLDSRDERAVPVDQSLTYADQSLVFDNSGSLGAVGGPVLDNYCGITSVAFSDEISGLGNCTTVNVQRRFDIQGMGGVLLQTCEQKLSFRNLKLDDIFLPPQSVVYDCEGDYETLSNGLPHPSESGYPFILTLDGYRELTETHQFNITVAFKDNLADIPGANDNVYQREWTIIDDCNQDDPLIYIQYIKINNLTPPEVECPLSNHYCPILDEDIMLFPMDPFLCTATVTAPPPQIINTCGEQTWMVRTEVLKIDGTDTFVIASFEPEETPTVSELEAGDYAFRYTVFSEQGVSAQKECIFRVADLQEPVAICRQLIHLSLSNSGGGRLYVPQIDRGSYDNCAIERIDLRRSFLRDVDTCEPLEATEYSEWGDYVQFNCCDADQLVKVEMRVTDINGLENICWVDVLVEDKRLPVCTGLEDAFLDCSELDSDFDIRDPLQLEQRFGLPDVIDNCFAYAVELEPEVNVDEDGNGSVLRRFKAIDVVGNESADIYTQLITVSNCTDAAQPGGTLPPAAGTTTVGTGIEPDDGPVLLPIEGHNVLEEVRPDVGNNLQFPIGGGETAQKDTNAKLRLQLSQNYPNPFSQHTRVSFELPLAGRVQVQLRDFSGRLLRQWAQEYEAGRQELIIGSDDLPGSGMYYYTLITAYDRQTRRMLLSK